MPKDAAKLEAHEDIALAIKSTAAADWPDHTEENLRSAISLPSNAGRVRSLRPNDLNSTPGLVVTQEPSAQNGASSLIVEWFKVRLDGVD